MSSTGATRSIFTRIRNKRLAAISHFKKGHISSYVAQLARSDTAFQYEPDITVAFQTFNKAHVLPYVLKPFIEEGFRNMVLFADGCADDTAALATRHMTGSQHFVVVCNNLHEIRTYGIATLLAGQNGSKYLMVAQDDDIYPADFSWLSAAKRIMEADPSIAVTGMNGGYDFVGALTDADDNYSTTRYEITQGADGAVEKLSPYFSITPAQARFDRDNFAWNYAAFVNRAPQLIRLSFLREIGGWPQQFIPVHDDDTYMCLKAWQSGYKVVHMPVRQIQRNVGIGGMRLFNRVSVVKRPQHMQRNWHMIYEEMGAYVNSGKLAADIARARTFADT